MSNSDLPKRFDLLVLGGGSGGLAAAKRAASYGAKVGLIEASRVGGTCVIRGCIPKKLMVYASELKKAAALGPGFGFLDANLGPLNWGELARRRDNVVGNLEAMHERYLKENGVTLIRGKAGFNADGDVVVNQETFQAEHTLIATGSTPRRPTFDGAELVATSDVLWDLQDCPGEIVIVGGGYIGVEYASLLAGLGSKVTLLARSSILRSFDRGIQHWAKIHLQQRGVTVVENAHVTRVQKLEAETFAVSFDHQGTTHTLSSNLALFGTLGRIPNTAGLGLEEVGIHQDTKNGGILVDEQHATSRPGVFALGDVLDRAQLTPLAIRAGRALADRLFAKRDVPVDYKLVPTAVFTTPPIGTVGLTETEASALLGENAEVFETHFGGLKYSFTSKDETPRTFMKLIRNRLNDQVVGVHIAGDDAAEMIQGFAVAIVAGATKSQFDATLAIHPTSAEELVLLKEGRPASQG